MANRQRHAEQQQQIVRDKPQLPGRGRERRPPQRTEGDIQPGEPAQQRDRHRVEPQRQPQRERAAGFVRLFAQKPPTDEDEHTARNARPAAYEAECEGGRQRGIVRNAALPGQVVADDEQHTQDAQQF